MSHDPDLDRGYAWVVVAASFMGHVIQYGVVWTVGIFYAVFLEQFDAAKGAVAVISSLNTAVYYITGPLAAMLTNRFGCRPIAMVGALIGSAGLMTSMFATNIYHLYATFGVLTGFGLGLAYIPTISMVGFYFEKRRSMAVGLAASGTGVGTFLYPPLLRFLFHQYGWRGTLLITGAVCLNMCVCAALFRPKDLPQINDNNNDTIKSVIKPEERTGIFSVYIFKNIPYLILCINNFFICFGLSVVYVHLSSYAATIGLTEDQGAMLFSALGIANTVGRLLFGFAAQIPTLRPLFLYAFTFFFSGVGTVLCTLATSFTGMLFYSSFFGLFTGSIASALPAIIIDFLDINFLTLGYGYILIFEALGTLTGGPVAGWLYDATTLYPSSLYLGGSMLMVGSLLMVYPMIRPNRSFKKPLIHNVSVPEIKPTPNLDKDVEICESFVSSI